MSWLNILFFTVFESKPQAPSHAFTVSIRFSAQECSPGEISLVPSHFDKDRAFWRVVFGFHGRTSSKENEVTLHPALLNSALILALACFAVAALTDRHSII